MFHTALQAAAERSWPDVILILGLLLFATFVLAGATAAVFEVRKTRILANQEGDLRQLVSRYEQLAEKTMDAQQRIATDVSELQNRTVSIEKILKSVE